MTRDEILTIAEAHSDMTAGWIFNAVGIERFWRAAYEAGAAAEREKVAAWMIAHLYATGHGDTTEDMLEELEWQIAERERKACADIAAQYASCEGIAQKIEQEIRERGEKWGR